MDRDLTRGRTFPDNVARSIKAPLERTAREPAPRYRERTSVIKESRVNVAAEVSHREIISAVRGRMLPTSVARHIN